MSLFHSLIKARWLRNIVTFLDTHERHLMSVAFIIGFIWDNLTLTRIDLLFENLVFLGYLCAATLGIIAYHARPKALVHFIGEEDIARWLPLVIQFAFGGLFSGYIIFYSQSASLWGSWPFLLLLIILFIGNETFRRRYEVLTFQLSILFVAIFSYTIFSIPILTHRMGTDMFVLSGVISLGVIALIAWLVFLLDKPRFRDTRIPLFKSIVSLFVVFNLAYFTNIIPPIPLSLKELGVYHKIEKVGDGYQLFFEEAPWYRPFDKTSTTFNRMRGEPIYAFSSVFAPTKLETTILHRWSYYDEKDGTWVVSSLISFPIIGGRDGGYRGYSVKSNVFPGYWRVDVITKEGLLIGRMPFKVETSDASPLLIEVVR